jgi:gamma-D-glutamyl-L-lysine dipeptidyl-peptidase
VSSRMIVATNLTDLHREPSFLSEMLTQVFNGAALEILESDKEWRRVRMPDGYEGWAYAPYLSESAAPAPTHLVCAAAAIFYSDHQQNIRVGSLPIGTELCVAEERNERARVQLAGGMLSGGWIDAGDLRPLSRLSPDAARAQMLEDARRLIGVYYLWGGNTAFGLDCSGLTFLLHRLLGISIPRDAHPQFAAGKPVGAPYRLGDLLFFHGQNDETRITHVGMSIGDWRIIHSSRLRNGVYEEDVQASDDLGTRFAGARSFL